MAAARLIEEADGLASLGLYGEAWEVLETLPPADRVRPAVLAIRLWSAKGWHVGSWGKRSPAISGRMLIPGIGKRRDGSTLAMQSPCVLLARFCGRVLPLGRLR